ncbi:hypothetical protein [Pedobacter heparinus]|uniref:Uncharacterized protein n=1 Tax=Pedobacter heparinus (strain ATCC 13125 / DSM 2366 / CIP 104194 / JCM 7457 / NBRC 12017 / NCIMB 9290 / NRRL B-14731 / HIM 762-3) TaxID=485917 RepID=C6XZK2_PEDHD|nr:hypothetical protein [Pedobacter heparinus]ACU04698.1 conserved hypothetical protein [Pedobacter heparinus DSM 2366]
MYHTFHIPVLGLGYSIDTPLKVARYGISSVVSIVDDELTERMRKFHSAAQQEDYTLIAKKETDCRALRITAYLNLLDKLVKGQFEAMLGKADEPAGDFHTYFELLPDDSVLKLEYTEMLKMTDPAARATALFALKQKMSPGSIDVNIMSKVDKANYNGQDEYLGDAYTDALAAMRGFANSRLNAAVIISAGLNPRLYSYMEQCTDFYPDASGTINKQIILKVSDFRSATIQAKLLAKKGLWVSEFRVESGLNCGGHAFATEGFLLGPILEEFKEKRSALLEELYEVYGMALTAKHRAVPSKPLQRITAQGGIGTAEEHRFLLNYYQLDAAGWGSPFLLVPEATNVDDDTLEALVNAEQEDFYLSNSSPLGVLFNSFKQSSMEQQRLDRITKGRPGSPCTKKFLCTNTEFTALPICTASREYQHLKLKELENQALPAAEYQQQFEAITEKVCLCEGLCAAVYLKNGMLKSKESKAVSICPGPNLAYFSGKYSLKEMVQHIYGKTNLLTTVNRPNLFINELNLYIDYLKKDISAQLSDLNTKKIKYFTKFKEQLEQGISYYKQLLPVLKEQSSISVHEVYKQLLLAEQQLENCKV